MTNQEVFIQYSCQATGSIMGSGKRPKTLQLKIIALGHCRHCREEFVKLQLVGSNTTQVIPWRVGPNHCRIDAI